LGKHNLGEILLWEES